MIPHSAQSCQGTAVQASFLCLLSGYLGRVAGGWWVTALGALGVLALATPLFLVPYWRRRWYAWWQLGLCSPSLLALRWWWTEGHRVLAVAALLVLTALLGMALASLVLDRRD